MRILIVTPSFFPIVGGSETLIRALSAKLNKLGIQTDIMAFNMDRKWNPVLREKVEHDGSCKIFKVPAMNPFSFLHVSPLYHPLRLNVLPMPSFKKKFRDYDIIHFLGEADLSVPILSWPVQKPKIMHCVGVAGLEKQFCRHPILRRMLTRVFRRLADLYIVFTSEEREILLGMGVKPGRVMMWSYGIDTEVFHLGDAKRTDNLVLFVGRIDNVKGLHVLLRSLRYLDVGTQVVIIGPVSKSSYFSEISRMCLEINRDGKHNVKYLGEMDQHDLVPWYQKTAVFVRPDLVGASGTGCSTLEAMACGAPVIGVQNHVVKHCINGLIVPPDDPVKLADALHKMLGDRQLREDYGREGRRTIEQYYSWNAALPKLIKAYDILLRNSRPNTSSINKNT